MNIDILLKNAVSETPRLHSPRIALLRKEKNLVNGKRKIFFFDLIKILEQF